jgi:hypothetical protein
MMTVGFAVDRERWRNGRSTARRCRYATSRRAGWNRSPMQIDDEASESSRLFLADQ